MLDVGKALVTLYLLPRQVEHCLRNEVSEPRAEAENIEDIYDRKHAIWPKDHGGSRVELSMARCSDKNISSYSVYNRNPKSPKRSAMIYPKPEA